MRRPGAEMLREELARLQRTLGHGYHLKVVWAPRENSDLDGEVKKDTIFVYSSNPRGALSTLRHEFLDSIVSELVEPYKQVANQLIALMNKQAYSKKEKLVEKLANLLS